MSLEAGYEMGAESRPTPVITMHVQNTKEREVSSVRNVPKRAHVVSNVWLGMVIARQSRLIGPVSMQRVIIDPVFGGRAAIDSSDQ